MTNMYTSYQNIDSTFLFFLKLRNLCNLQLNVQDTQDGCRVVPPFLFPQLFEFVLTLDEGVRKCQSPEFSCLSEFVLTWMKASEDMSLLNILSC